MELKNLCRKCARILGVRYAGDLLNWARYHKCDSCYNNEEFDMVNISDEESKRIRKQLDKKNKESD